MATATADLATLQSQLPTMLADFQQAYVVSGKNPSNRENEQILETSKTNINALNAQLFSLGTATQAEIAAINAQLATLDGEISSAKATNARLKAALRRTKDKSTAAQEQTDEYKEIYDYGYLRNWGLVTSIAVALKVISKTFTAQAAVGV